MWPLCRAVSSIRCRSTGSDSQLSVPWDGCPGPAGPPAATAAPVLRQQPRDGDAQRQAHLRVRVVRGGRRVVLLAGQDYPDPVVLHPAQMADQAGSRGHDARLGHGQLRAGGHPAALRASPLRPVTTRIAIEPSMRCIPGPTWPTATAWTPLSRRNRATRA